MDNSISLMCMLNRDYLQSNKKSIVYLAINVVPPDQHTESEILSSAICLLIDRSGSMWGKKLDQAKTAAQRMVDQLQPGDSIGLITFSSKVEPVLELAPIQSLNVEDLKRKIQKIRCGGGTELYRGLDTAFLQFMRSGATSPDIVKRIILLSDGQPTDHTPDSHFIKLATEMGNAGISVMALGIGKEYNEDLMGDIAENSRGVWKHISNADDIPGIFTQQVEETRAVVRTSVRISVALDSEVEIKDIYKTAPNVYQIDYTRGHEGEINLALGDVRTGEQQMVVAKLTLPAKPDGTFHIGRAYVTDDQRNQVDINIVYTSDEAKWSMENNAFSRGAYMQAETQTLTKKGLSGDTEAMTQAKQQADTLARDPNLRKLSDLQDDVTAVRETISRTEKGMTEEETKLAKQDMTQKRRAR
jgi:Ca-activated chloride channel family protein